MKTLSFPFLFLLLIACSSNTDKSEPNNFSNLSFTLDTVLVDAGEDIINLKGYLWISAVDPSGTYLYNWDQDNFSLEKINLDKLVLEEKIAYEKEGPHGAGSMVIWISLTEDDYIVMANPQDMSLFNFKGEKIKALMLRKEKFSGDDLKDNENFILKSILAGNGNQIFGVLGSISGKSFSLGKVDFESKTIKKYPLPDYDKLPDFSIKLYSPGRMKIVTAHQFIDQIKNRIIFSTSVFNSLYIYDLSLNSFYKVDYPTTLTKISKIGKYRNEAASEEEFQKVYSEIHEEINFLKPIWDDKNQRFYRFSYESRPATTLADGSKKYNNLIYLTIFDKDFNVLGENLVKELNRPPTTTFVKDGKIWIFENVEDELGFVRLTFI